MKIKILTIAILMSTISAFSMKDDNFIGETSIKSNENITYNNITNKNLLTLKDEEYINDIPFDTKKIANIFFIKNIFIKCENNSKFDYLKFDVNTYIENNYKTVEEDLKDL